MKIRNENSKRRRGRPPGVDTSERLTIQMRPEVKLRLESLSVLEERPRWKIVDDALMLYSSTLPEMRRMIADLTPEERLKLPAADFITEDDADVIIGNRGAEEGPPIPVEEIFAEMGYTPRSRRSGPDPERKWTSLAEAIGTGEYGGSSMSRLSKKEIMAAAKKRGVDPAVYLDGTRTGRNRLELAIQHRSEVLEALERGESVPAIALADYPDLTMRGAACELYR